MGPELMALLSALGMGGAGAGAAGAAGAGAGLGLAQGGMGALPAGGLGPLSGGTSGVLGGFPQMAQANQGLAAPVTSAPSQAAPQAGGIEGLQKMGAGFAKGVSKANADMGGGGMQGLDPMLLRLLGL